MKVKGAGGRLSCPWRRGAGPPFILVHLLDSRKDAKGVKGEVEESSL
jgi:hypothetical protein